ncbi:hypothetical protein [Flavobacterium sp.]|uniref:hypothetical protein n=1 Tax=Flavobacterium sp. TaxID=239 RepID=UPI0039191597
MKTSAQKFSLITAIILWGNLVGGVMYTHIVYFPAYLSHLPESNQLITGNYGLHDSHFWMIIHPLAILTTIITLILNWRLRIRRKYILSSFGIYILALLATAIYFVPELIAFADSVNYPNVTKTEWIKRGQTWLSLSLIRGFFIFIGFILLLLALSNDNKEEKNN